jgi:2-amino-4-hydroxy-6-hydroxymethyldihydropteridine diphosphokinase
MSNRSHIAYLGLGSNIGNREKLLGEAVRRLHMRADISVTAVSSLYETDPVGYTDQPLFLNIACRVETELSSVELLDQVLGIERALGRERLIRWGPRTIDIDVLLYDNLSIATPALNVPHPRIMERAFVLVPLLEVIEETERNWLPGFSQVEVTATGVRRWTNTNWPEEFEPSGN